MVNPVLLALPKVNALSLSRKGLSPEVITDFFQVQLIINSMR